MNNKKTNPVKFHYGWIIIIVCIIGVTGVVGFARFGYTMIFPQMQKGLELSDSQAGDLATGNMVGYLILGVTAGLLASVFSPKIVIVVSVFIVGLSMFLTGLADNFMAAFAGRVLTGLGSGGANVPLMGLLAAWFVTEKRGLASGMAVSGSSLGLFITGLLVPVIHNHFGIDGWRYSWYCLGSIVILISVICFLFLKNNPHEKNLKPVGWNPGSEEKKETEKKSLKSIFKIPAVWHIGIIYILFGFSYIIYVTFFARYLIWEGAVFFTEESAGGLWSLVGGISIASGFIWGSVSDRIGRKYTLAVVFILQSACYLIFGLWKDSPGFYISAGIFSLTAWSIPAIIAAASGDILGPKLAPAAFGFITLFFGIGQALGPFTAGRIADINGTYSPAFVTAGIAAFTGGVLSLFLKMKKKAACNKPVA
jgi:MFS family permease